jgi:hypothetical protein
MRDVGGGGYKPVTELYMHERIPQKTKENQGKTKKNT